MIFRLARKAFPSLRELERDPSAAHARVREHWATCLHCRSAAAASASLWCELGLELMKRGVAKHAHWDNCSCCREAQETIASGQCNRGRVLEQEFRVLAQRLA